MAQRSNHHCVLQWHFLLEQLKRMRVGNVVVKDGNGMEMYQLNLRM